MEPDFRTLGWLQEKKSNEWQKMWLYRRLDGQQASYQVATCSLIICTLATQQSDTLYGLHVGEAEGVSYVEKSMNMSLIRLDMPLGWNCIAILFREQWKCNAREG